MTTLQLIMMELPSAKTEGNHIAAIMRPGNAVVV
jgi:hypothetical protein